MTLLQAIILGVVEGITEFLPISSTGHLILASKLLNVPQTEFLKTFEISIQLGAILAVVVLYAKSLLINVEVMKRVAVAFLPTAVLGLVFYNFIKNVLMGNANVVLWAFLLGGIFLIVFDLFHKEDAESLDNIEKMPYRMAVGIGIFQAFAMVPGVSRAAATIIGGLILGMKRRTIVEFSFLLAIPTMMAATGLDLLKNAPSFSPNQGLLLGAGFITSFVVAVLGIKFLLYFIKTHNFIFFGIYRILAACLFWVLTVPK